MIMYENAWAGIGLFGSEKDEFFCQVSVIAYRFNAQLSLIMIAKLYSQNKINKLDDGNYRKKIILK